MRLLFCSTGGAGHLQPLRPLALALQRQGHDVGWVSAPDALQMLAGQGIALFPAGLDFETSRRQFRAQHPELLELEAEQRSAQTFPRLFGGSLAPAMLAGVNAAIAQWRPELMVLEPAALAGPLACALHGLRYLTHGYGLPLPPAYLEAATQCFAPSWAAHGLAAPAAGGLYRHGYIDIAPPSLQPPGHAGPPAPRRLALNPYAPRAAAGPALPEALQRALQAGRRPRVYLSFGTVFNRQPALVAAAHALLGLGAELVVTVGADGDPQRFAPHLPRLHVHRFIDQAALLPCCDAVVSHGGAGTLLGAAAHGLPQLVLPQGADHFRNARALAAAGAGLVVAPAAQTADGLRAAARQLFAGGPYAAAARRLAAEMAAMPGADTLASALADGTALA